MSDTNLKQTYLDRESSLWFGTRRSSIEIMCKLIKKLLGKQFNIILTLCQLFMTKCALFDESLDRISLLYFVKIWANMLMSCI